MIQVENLSRNYGDFVAVNNVSFQIGQGEIVGLLGHNGAGKTTIMKMLTGFLEPGNGSITIDGLDNISHRQQVQQKIGYLPENCPVYPEMTVIEYLEYAASLRGVPGNQRLQMVAKAIEQTELDPKAEQLISTLSRGYRQRVGVAQAILHRPPILILDEPTNGLDPSQIQHMRSLITGLAQKSTVILSTHILQEVQAICDRVLIIRNGHLALDARMEELQQTQHLALTIDQPPEAALPILQGLTQVAQALHQHSESPAYHYHLQMRPEAANSIKAIAEIARTIHEQGFQLYSLHTQRRDLETVFGEINRSTDKAA